MATIITLHGTNASGPEEGDRWWQRGSAFEKDIRKFVEPADGNLTFSPLVWSGFNSEVGRRQAAEKLAERITDLEKRGEKYCAIGHSHGGSVISHALLLCAARKANLPGLSRWFTVGTPFIAPRKAWMLFSRLGVTGRSAYLTFIAILLAFVIPAIVMEWGPNLRTRPLDIVAVSLGAALPFLIAYLMMLYFNARKLHHYRPSNQQRARELFGHRWTAFWHPDDEAICGLRSLAGLNIGIFEQKFAVPLITLGTLMVIPIGLLGYVLFNLKSFNWLAPVGFAGAGYTKAAPVTVDTLLVNMVMWGGLAALLGALVYIASLVVTYGISLLASLFSGFISDWLNRAANEQLRGRAYGYDAIGERGHGAAPHPAWLVSSQSALPADLASEVGAVSDSAAAISLAKFRGALSDLTFTKPGDRALSLDAYLCWDELIHTAYFSVERFRKLVAYSIATADGFRPSPALQSDPDFPRLQEWAAVTRQEPEQSPLVTVAA